MHQNISNNKWKRCFNELEDFLETLNSSSDNIVHTFKKHNERYFITLEQHHNPDNTLEQYAFKLLKQNLPALRNKVGEAHGRFLYNDEISHRVYQFEMWIDDFFITEPNNGLGSILMRELVKYAKAQNVMYIRGAFSHIDDNNTSRREHFYTKHGFKVSENGTICNMLYPKNTSSDI